MKKQSTEKTDVLDVEATSRSHSFLSSIRSLKMLIRSTKQLLVETFRLFVDENVGAEAKALTYSTLLGVVPFLAILFAIAKGFGLSEFLEEHIRAALPTSPETADTLLGFVTAYIDNTRGGIFLGFGIVMLLWSLLSLTDSIERSFNHIWQVKHSRDLSRKLVDYTAIVFLLPVLVFVSTGFTVFLSASLESLPDFLVFKSSTMVIVEVFNYLLIVLIFCLLYAFLPNTKVRFSSALVAAIPAAVAFGLWQNLYVHSQAWLSNYNAIYGSFAAIPLFMLWCLITWHIVLFGAALSSVYQNDVNLSGTSIPVDTRQGYDYQCIMVCAVVCQKFSVSERPPSAHDIATALGYGSRVTGKILETLRDVKLVHEVGNGSHIGFVPVTDVSHYTVGYVIDALDGTEVSDMKVPYWKELSDYREEAKHSGFANTLLTELRLAGKPDGISSQED